MKKWISHQQEFSQEKLSLCRFIGQAHLLPGSSVERVSQLLEAEIGLADWNDQPVGVLQGLVEKIRGEKQGI